jgi:hypothetical protein
MTTMPTVKQLADLAQEAEVNDYIEWNLLNVSKEAAYELMASNVREQISSIPKNQQLIVAMSTITKLLVENYLLNLKIQSNKNT